MEDVDILRALETSARADLVTKRAQADLAMKKAKADLAMKRAQTDRDARMRL